MQFFDYILAPFIFIIEKVFLFSYQLTDNYGWAIVLLSLGISLLLLPIFIYIEKAKRKDDALKLKMKPVADEIKRVYKGQERFYYLKTLNRQFNYSPFRALIPILTLLVQIPFFIAAYLYLENLQALKSVSFLFIPDLSQPDGLLGPINILPIAMTVVNLVTAWFYTRYGDKKERWQMVVVAGVFLIMLFNLPSGLVLYWTMNNVFSFFRLFVTNPEVFKKSKQKKQKASLLTKTKDSWQWLFPKLKTTFYVLSVVLLLGQINWAFQHSFNDIFLRIGGAILASLVFTFFIGLITTIHHIPTKIEWKPKPMVQTLWPHFKPFFIILSTIAILSQLNWALHFNFNTIVQRIILAIVGSALITFLFALVVLFYQNKIKTPTFIQQVKQTPWPQSFKIALAILSVAAVFSQINWALQFNFNNIVPRVIAALFGSWLIMFCALNIYRYYKNLSVEKISQIKTDIQEQWKKLKWFYIILTIAAVGSQLNWALHFNFDDFAYRLFMAVFGSTFIWLVLLIIRLNIKQLRATFNKINISSTLIFAVITLIVYFQGASILYYNGQHPTLGNIALFILIVFELFFFLLAINQKTSRKKYLNKGLSIASIIVLLVQITCFVGYLNPRVISANKSALFYQNMFIYAGLVSLILISITLAKPQPNKGLLPNKKMWIIYLLAIFYLSGFIFFWNPLTIYSSFPSFFSFPAIDILKTNLGLFIITSALMVFIFLIQPRTYKQKWLIAILTLTTLSFIHNTLFPIDLGTLQNGKYLNQDNLAQPLFIYVIEGLGIILIALFFKRLLRKNNHKPIAVALFVVNLILIVQSTVTASSTGTLFTKENIEPHSESSISFSKNEKNIAFIIADTFQGAHMQSILDEHPELKAQLEGFTWYPNTLSISSVTCPSLPAMLGGYDYTPEKMNKDERTIESKITDITVDFLSRVKKRGYKFTGNHFIYSTIDKNKFDVFLPKWHDEWNKFNPELNIGLPKEINYKLLWQNALLYSSPLLIKAKIYDKGNWLQKSIETNDNNSRTFTYNFLRLLPHISVSKNDAPEFIYIHSMAGHHPWDIIDENGILHKDVSPYQNNVWVLKKLVKWFNWMKENGVYDNTKIVLVSDHGTHRRHFKDKTNLKLPLEPNPAIANKIEKIETLFPLLMVKDYNEKGKLKKDNRLMSNADASYILFDENDPTKINPPSRRKLTTTYVTWIRRIWLTHDFKITDRFEVTDSVYNLNNWKKIN